MISESRQFPRRSFLKTASSGLLAAGAMPYLIPASALGKDNRASANDRILVGCIGVGDRGTAVMKHFLENPNAQVVAVCDVKSNVLKEKQNLVNEFYGNKDCQAYPDFRELVARQDIDACLVATCDHWHVLASLAAVRSGKDVYMEKPMGLTLEQIQTMREAVRKHKRVFQFGTQQRSDSKFRLACELVRNGKIGQLKSMNVWAPGSSSGGDPTPVQVPSWLDYEMWLGPAPFKPYTKDRCSNALWWFISDYAIGFIAGWGIHPIDIAVWGAPEKFTEPWEIEGTGEFPTEGVCDTAMNWNVKMQLANNVTLNFTGNPYPEEWKKRYEDDCSHGTAFEGTDGWVYVRRGMINARPKSILETTIEEPLYRSNNHVGNFLDCVKSRNDPVSNIEDSVMGDTICQVSDLAIRLKRELKFDAKRERFIRDREANKRLTRPMRKPWHL
ncbi:MAG: Gfo/Idh/MocA family oxidoreductase [bacterium]